MKSGKKKKVAKKSEKSKKKERSTEETPKEGTKWQEFLRRHSPVNQEKRD